MGKQSQSKGSQKQAQSDDSIMAPLIFTGFLIILPILYLLLKKKPNIKLPESYKPKPKGTTQPKTQQQAQAQATANEIKAKNEMSANEIKKLLKTTNAKKKKKPEHPSYFSRLSGIEGQPVDFALSQDNSHFVVVTQNRKHHLADVKALYTNKNLESLEWVTSGIPTKVALSETAQYTVIAFDYYLKVYKNNLKKKTVEEISNIEAKTNASRSSIVALFVNEQAKVIVFITSGKNNMIYATDLEGTLLDSQKLVSSDSYSAFYDTFQNRIVVKSSSTAVRIYRLKIDTFGKFKKLDTEYLCNGHSGKVLDGCFSSDGSRLISIATDKKAIMWDLSGRPFEDATVPKLVIHELSEDYRVIEWCKWLSKDHNTAIVCMIGDHALDYFKFGPNIFEKVDTVEDPHLGSRCEDLVIINKDGKGVGLLSRSWDKVTSWKPKIKDIVE